MIKATINNGSEIEINSLAPEIEEEIVVMFNLIPNLEKNRSQDIIPIKELQNIPMKYIVKLELIKENLIGIYDCLQYCSDDFVQNLYKKGLLR